MEGEQHETTARPAVNLGPTCPHCGEPWLRPTNLPGRYRCVYCLHPLRADLRLPELRRAFDDREDVLDCRYEVQQLRRFNAAAHMSAI